MKGRTGIFAPSCGFIGRWAETRTLPLVDQDEMNVIGHTNKIVTMNAGKVLP